MRQAVDSQDQMVRLDRHPDGGYVLRIANAPFARQCRGTLTDMRAIYGQLGKEIDRCAKEGLLAMNGGQTSGPRARERWVRRR